MNLIKRIKTLWILSGWDIKKSRKEGSFTIDGIARPEIEKEYIHKQPIIIKRTTPVDKFLNQDAK